MSFIFLYICILNYLKQKKQKLLKPNLLTLKHYHYEEIITTHYGGYDAMY